MSLNILTCTNGRLSIWLVTSATSCRCHPAPCLVPTSCLPRASQQPPGTTQQALRSPRMHPDIPHVSPWKVGPFVRRAVGIVRRFSVGTESSVCLLWRKDGAFPWWRRRSPGLRVSAAWGRSGLGLPSRGPEDALGPPGAGAQAGQAGGTDVTWL